MADRAISDVENPRKHWISETPIDAKSAKKRVEIVTDLAQTGQVQNVKLSLRRRHFSTSCGMVGTQNGTGIGTDFGTELARGPFLSSLCLVISQSGRRHVEAAMEAGMTARNQDIGVYRGDTATLTISLTAADGSAYDPSVEVDIEWRMSPMRHTDEADALVRKSLADGIVIVPGGVEITLSAIDTDFEPGVYYQEMKVVDAGDVSTTMIGAVVIKPALRMTASTHRSPPAISATPRSSSLPSQPPAVLRGLGRARACNRGRPYRADHQRRRQARPCQPAKPMQGMPTGQDRRRALRLDVDSAEVSRLRH